ncbi:Gluconate 2-dehydrogenase subunit 3 precursor [Serratia rubidaea]|uniref:Gluconate 2-dehydrogenase subunit 3 family protein n=1 Tax=Serratia rhizosphaerae TaxID=2597702 RepID=A0ABX6GIF5_9GAMM|nr:gluconate 2-dehydrogenase subunit 3 family protein [Serratia rhizosphaerae]MBU3894224.1 gluconate 2-dehydrogenase subunit 3 family protein [Serratia rubidaea]QHA86051.1 gluconate 2-dehydrogenase subunit 3 family protein [Serratia rhizosphaerae]SQJ24252.1 Gluconate 2-dehydrogenase subunit 3 precursor [Serratia rubidaea]
MKRRSFIKAGLILAGTGTAASIFTPAGAAERKNVLNGGKIWRAKETPLPTPADPTQRLFFNEREYALVTAIFDRLIPADELSVSASQAGCVVFIDNQLAGDYGKAKWKYNQGPFENGTESQGNQSPYSPAEIYRKGLQELDTHCTRLFNKSFTELSHDMQDAYLEKMESGEFTYPTFNSEVLFGQFLANVQEGFLADPIYGGNRNMVGWRMIGFPGARYDYRDYAPLKGQKLNIEPISIIQLLKA